MMRTNAAVVKASCAAVALLLVIACAKKAPEPHGGQTSTVADVAEVSLGRTVNSARQVDVPMEDFAPADTIFASVKTENTPVGTRITARWVFTEGGAEQVVSENELLTNQPGTGYTSFHIVNPGPWPAGKYEVRIGLNGDIKKTKGFSVRG